MKDLFLLQPKRIGYALKQWREAKRLKPAEIVERSRKVDKEGKGFQQPEISKFEAGVGFSYDRLVGVIFPAYGIEDICDLDLFLDLCKGHSLEDVVFIKRTSNIVHVNQGTEEILINPEDLNSNRSRISIIKIKPGKCTKWQNHEGHEYVLVSKGHVKFEYAQNENDDRKAEELEQGQGVAFPSALFHSFINLDGVIAEIIIARPTKSLPRGMGP